MDYGEYEEDKDDGSARKFSDSKPPLGIIKRTKILIKRASKGSSANFSSSSIGSPASYSSSKALRFNFNFNKDKDKSSSSNNLNTLLLP